MLAPQSIEDALKRLRDEREEADRLYNEALTALDRAILQLPARPSSPPPYDEHQITPLNSRWNILPPEPVAAKGGLRGRFQAAVWQIVAPLLERQQSFNSAVVDHINRNVRHHRELQQITLYVDKKDRDVAGVRLPLAAAISAVGDELHKRWEAIGILQQATMSMKRELERLAGNGLQQHDSTQASSGAATSLEAFKYVGFEDRYRGSREAVREKLAPYVWLFEGATNVLDAGCGRGEFLGLLREQGVTGQGVDLNPDMVELCRTAGFTAAEADALTYLNGLPDASLGGLFSSQLVEHLQPGYLVRLLETAFHKLKPGAKIVLETINPACWAAFFSAYIRDITHAQPIHPETLSYLAAASGFANVSIRYSAPFADAEKLQVVTAPGDSPALRSAIDIYNENVERLNNLIFTYRDYAVVGERAGSRPHGDAHLRI
jgi:SAM-dependent methyltransferase